ncbi:unnamed protein product, partial [Effrenium voratum]
MASPLLVLPSISPFPDTQALCSGSSEGGNGAGKVDALGSWPFQAQALPSTGWSSRWSMFGEQALKDFDALKQRSEENRLQDAMDALDAALQALQLAEEICRCISHDLAARDHAVASRTPSSHEDGEGELCPAGRPDVQNDSQGQLCSSRLGNRARPLELGKATSVEGVLRVEGDVMMNAQELQEVLRGVLLQLVGEVQDVELVCTRCKPSAPTYAFPSLEGSFFGAYADPTTWDGLEFAFKVVASDLNDLEPVRETLLLEA